MTAAKSSKDVTKTELYKTLMKHLPNQRGTRLGNEILSGRKVATASGYSATYIYRWLYTGNIPRTAVLRLCDIPGSTLTEEILNKFVRD